MNNLNKIISCMLFTFLMAATNILYAQESKTTSKVSQGSISVRSANSDRIDSKGIKSKNPRKDTTGLSKPIRIEKSVIPAKSGTPRITERAEGRIKTDKDNGKYLVKDSGSKLP